MAGGAPGPGGSRVPAGGKVIHRQTELPPERKAEAEKTTEVTAGLRCGGCGERVQRGYEFTFIETGRVDGKTYGNYHNLVACRGRADCDFAAVCADEAVAVRVVDQKFIDTPELREMMKAGMARTETKKR